MRILVDAQLPAALAQWLCAAGHEAVHVEKAFCVTLMIMLSGHKPWANGAVVITKDEDFAARAERSAPPTPLIVWLRVGNATNPRVARMG